MRLKFLSSQWRRQCGIGGVAVVIAISTLLVPFAPRADAGTVAMSFTSISSARYHTCGISAGKAYCWGYGSIGALGQGAAGAVSTPIPVDTSGVLAGKTILSIANGSNFSCAIASDQKAYCWGGNNFGSLGNGTNTDSTVPVAVDTSGVLAGKSLTKVAAGIKGACAIDTAGKAYCWGPKEAVGDNPGGFDRNIPVAVDTTGILNGKSISKIEVAETNACALTTDGIVACWGLADGGQLGDGGGPNNAYPHSIDMSGVLAGKTITQLSVGGAHSCVLASDAKLYCWGYNGWGQLGNNSTTSASSPTAVTMTGALSGKTIALLDSGYENTCVTVTTGQMYCWGMGTYGEIGNGTNTARYLVPTAVTTSGAMAGRTITAIDAGHGDTTSGAGSVCAVTSSGRSYCWGLNDYGQLGNASTTNSNVPVLVVMPSNLTAGSYRFYQNANSATPGSALATTNTAPTLAATGATFRLRTGVSAVSSGDLAGLNTFKLQFAQLTAASCSAQTGFLDVTGTSVISWNTNAGVTNGATITTNVNDPTSTGATTAQTYQSAVGPFGAPTDTPAGNTAEWDFSLKDNGAVANSDYCLRIVYASGAATEGATAYPQFKTAAGSILGVDIVDAGGTVVGSPAYALTTATVKTACQAVVGTFATSAQRIRVTNTSASNGWTLSMAPTGGATDLWNRSDSGAKYDFNDSSGTPAGCNSGSDGDGYAGQLTVDPSGATVTAQSGCNTTGISKGISAKYDQGVVDAITLLSASSSAATGCYWDMVTTTLSQQIPGGQPSGSYSISMTLTAVAQ